MSEKLTNCQCETVMITKHISLRNNSLQKLNNSSASNGIHLSYCLSTCQIMATLCTDSLRKIKTWCHFNFEMLKGEPDLWCWYISGQNCNVICQNEFDDSISGENVRTSSACEKKTNNSKILSLYPIPILFPPDLRVYFSKPFAAVKNGKINQQCRWKHQF